MTNLTIQERDPKKKPAALRAEGFLPAVFYGPKEEAQAVTLDARDFEKVWKEEGSSTIVTLKGVGDDKEALIQEVDTHPVTGVIQHADLYIIERGKKLEVDIPIEFVGEAPAEKAGHTVVKVMHEIKIEVRPSELPQNFEVNLGSLSEIGDHISVKDIKLPESGEFKTDPDETVVSVKETIEEVDKDPETPDFSEAAEGEEGAAPSGDDAAAEGGEEKSE